MLDASKAYASLYSKDVWAKCKCAAMTICYAKPTNFQYGTCPSCKASFKELKAQYEKDIPDAIANEKKAVDEAKKKISEKKRSKKRYSGSDSDEDEEEDEEIKVPSSVNPTVAKKFKDYIDPIYLMHVEDFKAVERHIGVYVDGVPHQKASDIYEKLQPRSMQRKDMLDNIKNTAEAGDVADLIDLLITICGGDDEAEGEEEGEEGTW